MTVADAHCPLRQMKVTTIRPKYITLELLELMLEQDTAFKMARANQSVESWNHARILWGRDQSQIYRARKSYIQQQIKNSNGDSKKFWSTIKKEFYKVETKRIETVFNARGHILLSGKATADRVNLYFSEISGVLSKRFNDSNAYGCLRWPGQAIQHS